MKRKYRNAQRIVLVREEINDLIKEENIGSLRHAKRILIESGANNKKLEEKINKLLQNEELKIKRKQNEQWMNYHSRKAARCKRCKGVVAFPRKRWSSRWNNLYHYWTDPSAIVTYKLCRRCKKETSK